LMWALFFRVRTMSGEGDITKLLHAWQEGDVAAGERLAQLVYHELKKVASAYLRREREGSAYQTTELVNEAFMRLVDQKNLRLQDRVHFFGVSAKLMRQILVEHVRKRQAQKRGGEMMKITFDDAANLNMTKPSNMVRLDEVLDKLESFDSRKSRLVELRFFAGMSLDEIAEIFGVSVSTVKREWLLAKAWLYNKMME